MLTYCKMDTEGMVRIIKQLGEIVRLSSATMLGLVSYPEHTLGMA